MTKEFVERLPVIMESAAQHCLETPMMDFEGNPVDTGSPVNTGSKDTQSRLMFQPVSVATSCVDCSRLFEPNSSSMMKCDACWVTGLTTGKIRTGMRKFKKMRIGEKGEVIYECDFCKWSMEKGRELHQWCTVCTHWWRDHMQSTAFDEDERIHTHARLVSEPVTINDGSSDAPELLRDIKLIKNKEEVVVAIPRDGHRVINVNVTV